MEKTIAILIYIHAGFGGIALLAGLVSLVAKKGGYIHKKAGVIFFYSMLVSAITAMVVSFLPKHESPFLFAVGIFSLYFILTGYRALKFKDPEPKLQIDKLISRTMFITGLLMIFLPIILTSKINIILTVFAIVGIIFSIRDLMLYKDMGTLKKSWLKLHLGKMIGGYISATTAFVVVNDFFPSFYGWFVPGIIGGLYITYWIRRLNRRPTEHKTK
ncbi:MAG: DUF2306 domain-containing protein [Maribacter sp.]|uniref:DUF2306 domain-containing protein n=1 Tax=Maribacter sp. TaxID=1897614 RepID=UPI003C7371B5